MYRWVTITSQQDPENFWLSPVMAEVIGHSAAEGHPTVLVREQPRYLLLGPKDRRLPRILQAAQSIEDEGWPVFMRIGGGSAVLLDGTCLSFAVARACRDLTTLERNFRELGQGVVLALGRLGLPAQFGAAPGSYCEGPYDLVVGGKKVAGISQAIRRGFALVSGMILVSQDPVTTTARLQRLYREAGSDQRLSAEAVTSLEILLGRELSLQTLRESLFEGFETALGPLLPGPIRDEEWQQGRTIYPERRFPARSEPASAAGS